MEALVVLPVLILLALCVGAVLGYVAMSRTAQLRSDLRNLRRDHDALVAAFDAVRRQATERSPAAPEASIPEIGEPIPAVEPVPPVEPALARAAEPAEETADGAAAPEAQAPEATPAAASVAAPSPAPAGRSLEEAIGTRWAVWVGGLALALGGVFLVRYSIEAGLLGPAARILLGHLFGGVLLAGGEWLRRSGTAETPAAGRGAYVPGVLTAAGTTAAFASLYAAYALYGFLGPVTAFLALAAVSLATLSLAILHGPALAGLGLAASYASPLLVSSDQPSFGSLSVYLVVVTVATLGVARLRLWRWLAITAVAGTVLWAMFMSIASFFSGLDGPVIAGFIGVSYALAHLAFVTTIHPDQPGLVAPADRVATAMLALFAAPILVHLAMFGTSDTGIALLVGYAAVTLAAGYAHPAVRHATFAGAAVVLLAIAAFDVPSLQVLDPATMQTTTPDLAALLRQPSASRLIGVGLLIGLMMLGIAGFGVLGSASRAVLAVVGAFTPLAILGVVYLRIAEFDVSVAFGLSALVLAGFFAVAAEALGRRLTPGEHGVDGAIAAVAVACIASLAAGLAMMTERGVLTVALALIVPAIAFVEARRPVPALRPTAVAVAALVCLRFLWEPRVAGDDLGTTPVFNWLLWGYGVPALAFGLAARRFARTYDEPRLVPIFEALAVIFTTLTVVMLIHHGMNGGNLYAPVSGLLEQSLLVSSMLAVSLGLQWLAARRPSPVFSTGMLVAGAIGLVGAGVGLGVTQNPVATGEPMTGGALDGSLLVGYLLPAALAFAVAALARRRPDRPLWYVRLAAALGGVLVWMWATLAVRAAWHPGDLGTGDFREAELYAYSAVWLVLGLAVLAAGVVLRSQPVRMVATGLVLLVVVKVFLFDTSGLTGALRALSFIGLGAVLVAVGLAYQKFLRRAA